MNLVHVFSFPWEGREGIFNRDDSQIFSNLTDFLWRKKNKTNEINTLKWLPISDFDLKKDLQKAVNSLKDLVMLCICIPHCCFHKISYTFNFAVKTNFNLKKIWNSYYGHLSLFSLENWHSSSWNSIKIRESIWWAKVLPSLEAKPTGFFWFFFTEIMHTALMQKFVLGFGRSIFSLINIAHWILCDGNIILLYRS